MPENTRMDFDSPWKEAVECYFEAFIAFFFPLIHGRIDWRKGYEFMDKELEKAVRDADMGRRHVDKLVKVFLPEGKETWLHSILKFRATMTGILLNGCTSITTGFLTATTLTL